MLIILQSVWTEHFLSFEKAGAQTPLQLWGGLKNCWAWANPVKDMMCDISLLSCSHVKTHSGEKSHKCNQTKTKTNLKSLTTCRVLCWGPCESMKYSAVIFMIYVLMMIFLTEQNHLRTCLSFAFFKKKSLNICFVFFNICKLHVLRLKTGLNSPTFKVRNKFGPNLLTYLISLTPTH